MNWAHGCGAAGLISVKPCTGLSASPPYESINPNLGVRPYQIQNFRSGDRQKTQRRPVPHGSAIVMLLSKAPRLTIREGIKRYFSSCAVNSRWPLGALMDPYDLSRRNPKLFPGDWRLRVLNVRMRPSGLSSTARIGIHHKRRSLSTHSYFV
jgi:hypothetical protein